MRLIRAWCVVITTCPLIAGCMVGPNFHSPKSPQTSRYTSTHLPAKTVGTKKGNASKAQQFDMGRDIPADWWEIFHSSEIDALVKVGIENSPTLASAKAALREAQDTYYSQIGNLLVPSFSLNGSAERSRISQLGFGNPGPSNVFNVINATANVSYLLDVFGGSRRQIEAYKAQVDYQRFQLEAAYLTLTTNIVTTAVTIASLEGQVNAMRSLIKEQKKQLAIIKKQYHWGGSSYQNVLTQQTLVGQSEALLPPMQYSLEQSQHALAVLLGKLPSEVAPQKINLDALNLPASLPVSLPSELAAQRPDIQAAEALMHAASAQIGVATANMLPQLTITGYYGGTSQTLNTLLNPNSRVWDIGANIAQPIFHGGFLYFQRKAAIAAYEQTQAQYKQVVLQAFQNVADTLRAIEFGARTYKAQSDAEASAKKSYLLTKKQYRLGATSYLALLTAQQQYEQTKINLIQAQATRYNNTAALYAALGGGWWNRPEERCIRAREICKEKYIAKNG